MPGTRRATDPLVSALEAAYRRLGGTGRSVLLATSGGADSTALLLATARLRDRLALRPAVASLDHGLRPESRGEVQAVASLAAELGLPFHTRRLRLRPGAAIEQRARDARYAALEEIRQAAKLELVATAHTASDQAETLLMRLCRGASARGAAAVRPRRGTLIRPMLEVTRAQVEAYLARRGVPFVDDPMNHDRAYLRTRFRLEVLPALKAAAGDQSERRLAAFASLIGEDDELLTHLADAALARLRVGPGLDVVGVRALLRPIRRRVLVRLIEGAGAAVDHDLIERAVEALDRGRAVTLPAGLSLRCAGGLLRIVPARSSGGQSNERKELRLDGPPVFDSPSGLVIQLSSSSRPSASSAALPPAPLPFEVRHRRPGDRVGSRKLQDLLVDRRVPAEQRDRVPLVCDANGQIVWVVGLWPTRRAPGSAATLHLTAEPSRSS